MARWTEHALVEAPLEEVWDLLSDPTRFAEWNPETIEVTGVPTRIEKGSSFEQKNRGPLGTRPTTVFKVDELEDMKEIKLRCQTSGYYSRWVLTEAQGNTFAEMELGVEPEGLPRQARLYNLALTKGQLRRTAAKSLDGLRRATGRG